MNRLLFLFLCIPFLTNAQTVETKKELGIHFEKEKSWSMILAAAKAERKYIFVDCYATWCGPCKKMSSDIFPQPTVGDYFNSHFINVAAQLDKTDKDPKEIRDWYLDAERLAKEYEIHAFPTYLFFSPDGELVHRIAGARETSEDFIAIGKDAQDNKKQYYSIVNQFKDHEGDSLYLRKVLDQAIDLSDMDHAIAVGQCYFASLKAPQSKDNIVFFANRRRLITSTKDNIFLFFLNHSRLIDSVMDDSTFSEYALCDVIYKEQTSFPVWKDSSRFYLKKLIANVKESYPNLNNSLLEMEKGIFRTEINSDMHEMLKMEHNGSPDWVSIRKSLSWKYPNYNFDMDFFAQKAGYFYKKKNWRACEEAAYELLHRCGQDINDFDINEFVWSYIFLHGKDNKIFKEGSKWMEKSLVRVPDRPNSLDTYANLLYKRGQIEQAIKYERKALASSPSAGRVHDACQMTLEKMEKGLPTWEDDTPIVKG